MLLSPCITPTLATLAVCSLVQGASTEVAKEKRKSLSHCASYQFVASAPHLLFLVCSVKLDLDLLNFLSSFLPPFLPSFPPSFLPTYLPILILNT